VAEAGAGPRPARSSGHPPWPLEPPIPPHQSVASPASCRTVARQLRGMAMDLWRGRRRRGRRGRCVGTGGGLLGRGLGKVRRIRQQGPALCGASGPLGRHLTRVKIEALSTAATSCRHTCGAARGGGGGATQGRGGVASLKRAWPLTVGESLCGAPTRVRGSYQRALLLPQCRAIAEPGHQGSVPFARAPAGAPTASPRAARRRRQHPWAPPHSSRTHAAAQMLCGDLQDGSGMLKRSRPRRYEPESVSKRS
jgi:hypothetical protein